MILATGWNSMQLPAGTVLKTDNTEHMHTCSELQLAKELNSREDIGQMNLTKVGDPVSSFLQYQVLQDTRLAD